MTLDTALPEEVICIINDYMAVGATDTKRLYRSSTKTFCGPWRGFSGNLIKFVNFLIQVVREIFANLDI